MAAPKSSTIAMANWDVESISTRGLPSSDPKERAAGKCPWIYVKAPGELSLMIYERLYGSVWSAKVQDAINRATCFRVARTPPRARYDMRRDEGLGGCKMSKMAGALRHLPAHRGFARTAGTRRNSNAHHG